MSQYDAFLSYARDDDQRPDGSRADWSKSDESFMCRLYEALTKAGLKIWWDREKLESRGLSFSDEIRDAINDSRRLVLVVGPHAVLGGMDKAGQPITPKEWVQKEIEHAQTYCIGISPILRLGDYDSFQKVPYEFRKIARGDIPDFRNDADFDRAVKQLIRQLQGEVAPMGTLHGVPLLPTYYIKRHAALDELERKIRLDSDNVTVISAQGRQPTTDEQAVAVQGMGGIGKSTLAAAMAHDCDVRRMFPDGIYWVELKQTPNLALRQADLGARFGDDVNEYPDEQRGKQRLGALLEHKQALIILDDVWKKEHADAFLVRAPRCCFLLTTRLPRLVTTLGLTAQSEVKVTHLTEAESLDLLTKRLGEPTDDLKALYKRLHTALEGHTLAISLAAAQLSERGLDEAGRYTERLERLIREAKAGADPFKNLDMDETDKTLSVAVTLEDSYKTLKPDLQRRFRQLGIFAPDGTFNALAAAWVWGDVTVEMLAAAAADAKNRVPTKAGEASDPTPPLQPSSATERGLGGEVPGASAELQDALDTARDALLDLTRYALLTQVDGRYDQHALLRAHARARMTEAERTEVFDRYADYYTAQAAQFKQLPPEDWGVLEADLPDIHHLGDTLVKLCASGETYLERGLGFADNITRYLFNRRQVRRLEWLEMGLQAARQLANRHPEDIDTYRRREALFLNDLGLAWDDLGEKRKALDFYEQALPLRRAVGDRGGEAATLNNIGKVWDDLGEKRKALDFYEQALPLQRAVGDRGGEAATLTNIGSAWSALGEKRKALDFYQQALPLRRAVGDRGGEAATLNNIGSAWSALGEKRKALDFYEQALPLQRAVGDRGGEATTLNNIGLAWYALGEKRKALDFYEQALPLTRSVGDRGGEAATLNNIGGAWSALGEKRKALDFYEQALSLYRDVGDRGGEATTLNNIGGAWSALGEKRKALDFYEQALPLTRAVGDRGGEATTLSNIGGIYFQTGQIEKAIGVAHQIIEVFQQIGAVSEEAAARLNIARALMQVGKMSEAIIQADQSLELLRSHGLPQAASGVTVGQIEAFLAQLRDGGSAPADPQAEFARQIMALYQQGGAAAVRQALVEAGAAAEVIEGVVAQVERLTPPPPSASPRDAQSLGEDGVGSSRVTGEGESGTAPLSTLPPETVQTLCANTVAVRTAVPDKLDEWQAQLTSVRADWLTQGADWEPEVAFIEALLAVLRGESPVLADGNPYAGVVAQVVKAVAG